MTFLAYEPAAQSIGQWMQNIFWGAGIVATLLGIAVAIKNLRTKPTPSPAEVSLGNKPLIFKPAEEMATVSFVTEALNRVDTAALERDAANNDRIVAVGKLMDERHKENVGHFKEIERQLAANQKEVGKQHEVLREEVRHDVRRELTGIDTRAQDRFEDLKEETIARFDKLEAAGERRIAGVNERTPEKIIGLLKTTGVIK